MKKNIIITCLIFLLSTFAFQWYSVSKDNAMLNENIIEQREDVKKASIKIANLEEAIVEKDKDLNRSKLVIEKQDTKINNYKEKNSSLEKKLSDLKLENINIKKRLNKLSAEDDGESPTTNASTSKPIKTITVNASAYTAYCDGCSGLTATEYNVKNTIYYKGYRIIASDPKVIPMYSIVEIEGFSEKFIAIDKGGAIKGNKIDVLVKSKSDAYAFGRKNVKLNVIKLGGNG